MNWVHRLYRTNEHILPAQVLEEDLHCVVVRFWQLLDQVFD